MTFVFVFSTEKALTKSIPEFEANVKKVKSELKETAANEASLAAKVYLSLPSLQHTYSKAKDKFLSRE